MTNMNKTLAKLVLEEEDKVTNELKLSGVPEVEARELAVKAVKEKYKDYDVIPKIND